METKVMFWLHIRLKTKRTVHACAHTGTHTKGRRWPDAGGPYEQWRLCLSLWVRGGGFWAAKSCNLWFSMLSFQPPYARKMWEGGGLDHVRTVRTRGKVRFCTYFKGKPTRLADGLDVGCERRVKDDSEVFSLRIKGWGSHWLRWGGCRSPARFGAETAGAPPTCSAHKGPGGHPPLSATVLPGCRCSVWRRSRLEVEGN